MQNSIDNYIQREMEMGKSFGLTLFSKNVKTNIEKSEKLEFQTLKV